MGRERVDGELVAIDQQHLIAAAAQQESGAGAGDPTTDNQEIVGHGSQGTRTYCQDTAPVILAEGEYSTGTGEQPLSGLPEHMAEVLARFADSGIDEVQCAIVPGTVRGVQRLRGVRDLRIESR